MLGVTGDLLRCLSGAKTARHGGTMLYATTSGRTLLNEAHMVMFHQFALTVKIYSVTVLDSSHDLYYMKDSCEYLASLKTRKEHFCFLRKALCIEI